MLNATEGQSVLNLDMLINLKNISDWKPIRQRKEKRIEKTILERIPKEDITPTK